MNNEQQNFLKQLDPNGDSGTIQSVMLQGNLDALPFEGVLRFLLRATLDEKASLEKENTNMRKWLQKHNLYCEEAVFGEK